jgi:putative ABC transport system ATP-binding protein
MITITGLTRRFRRGSETITALDGVSLTLVPGELTVAAGASGSGKTTLLSIIAGYERADSGSVTRNGAPTADLPWSKLGFVPQSLTLAHELTVAENVDLPARLFARRAGRGAIDTGPPTEELMARLEIGHLAQRYPDQISGGEQQRAAIGRALRLRPGVVIGDEPTGHQDRVRIDLVLDLFREHAYAGNIVLISSHDEAVLSVADRIIALADGRIIDDRRPRTVPA